MYPYQGKPGELVFVHIPKTGGSSIRTLYAKNKTHPNIKNVYGKARTEGAGGHVAYNPNIQAQYFTILRDPIKRCWSHFHEFKRNKTIKRTYKIDGKPWDKTWRSLVNHNYQFSNFASVCITGTYDCDFEMTISALKKYIYVGRFEDYTNTYNSICSIIGLDEVKVHHSNKNKTYKKTVPADFRNVLTKMNQLDIEVYNWCLENIWKG